MMPSKTYRLANMKPSAMVGLGKAALVLHVLAICLLAYFASAWLVDATAVILVLAGAAKPDGVLIASMAGFVYLCLILLWAFSQRSIQRTWIYVGGLALLAWALAEVLGGKV